MIDFPARFKLRLNYQVYNNGSLKIILAAKTSFNEAAMLLSEDVFYQRQYESSGGSSEMVAAEQIIPLGFYDWLTRVDHAFQAAVARQTSLIYQLLESVNEPPPAWLRFELMADCYFHTEPDLWQGEEIRLLFWSALSSTYFVWSYNGYNEVKIKEIDWENLQTVYSAVTAALFKYFASEARNFVVPIYKALR